jgi:quercetin dioxygenase-like cupin family protein
MEFSKDDRPFRACKSCAMIGLVAALAACAPTLSDSSRPPQGSAAVTPPPDPVVVAPERYSVVFENERVRVLSVQYPPGVTTEFHGHPENLVVALTPIISNPVDIDGNITEYRTEAGEVLWREPATHRGTNSGDEEMRVIMIEFKDAPDADD